MQDAQWKEFFLTAANLLGPGDRIPFRSNSWCSWTTFGRLGDNAGYWTCGLPKPEDIFETAIGDNGVWGQPFLYSSLAHIIVPREFYWENYADGKFECGHRKQDIDQLSITFKQLHIPHRKTELILEIKLF